MLSDEENDDLYKVIIILRLAVFSVINLAVFSVINLRILTSNSNYRRIRNIGPTELELKEEKSQSCGLGNAVVKGFTFL